MSLQPNPNYEEEGPWWAKLAIAIGIFATAVGVLISLGVLLNRHFPIRELTTNTGAQSVNEVLATLDAQAGMPTAVTPPTISIPTLTPSAINDYNLILIGNDYQPGREPECEECMLVHSDVFIYVNISFDENGGRATLISLPRELYLRVDGIEPDSRINQLYARGGIEWVKLWTETILGVEIDGVFVINMDEFEYVIDELGGIVMYIRESFRDKCGNDFYEYEKGNYRIMDGHETLCYARMRLYNPDGYFARQERHTEIIFAIFNKVLTQFWEDPLVTSVKMVSSYYETIETNMSPEILAKMIADIMIYYTADGHSLDVFEISVDADNLELYPRANDDSPYLYKPTFVLSDWLQCVLTNSWPYDCGLD